MTISMYSHGQINESEIYGEWAVKKVLKKPSNPEFRGVLDGFRKATFTFHENGKFDLKTASQAPKFQIILKMTEGVYWRFDDKAQLIKVGGKEDGYSIMAIRPTKKDNIMIFSLDEGEMSFEMEKL